MLTRCFWPPDSSKIEPVPEAWQADIIQGFLLADQNLVDPPTQIFEAEADFVANAGVNDLCVGVLENHSYVCREVGNFRVGDDLAADDGEIGRAHV